MTLTEMNQSEYKKERYQWLKSHRICVCCGQQDAFNGRTRCADCNYILTEGQLRRYKKKDIRRKRKNSTKRERKIPFFKRTRAMCEMWQKGI